MGWASPEIAVYVNAGAFALVGFYGWWLKGVVDVQVKGKDATIESLKTEVERLTKQTSPALADYVTKANAALEVMAKDVAELQRKLEEAEKKSKDTVAEPGEDKIQIESIQSSNKYMTQLLSVYLKEMQETIDSLKKDRIELSESGWLAPIPVIGEIRPRAPSRSYTASDIVFPGWTPDSGSIDPSKPSPIDEATDTKPKKPKFEI
jgi:hypothetical protein